MVARALVLAFFLGALSINASGAGGSCQTSPWSAWSACSKSCGTGIQSHTRSLVAEAPCDRTPALTKARACHRQACIERRRLNECHDTVASDFIGAGECASPRTGMAIAPAFALADGLVSDQRRCLPKCGWHFGTTEADGSWRWSCARDASLYCDDSRPAVRSAFRSCCPVSCNAPPAHCGADAPPLGCTTAPQGATHNSIDISGLVLCCPVGWVGGGRTCTEPGSGGAACFLFGGVDPETPCPSVQAFSPDTLPTAAQRTATDAGTSDIETALGLDPTAVEPASAPQLRPVGADPLPTHTATIPPAVALGANLCSHLTCRAELHRCSRYATDRTLRVIGSHFKKGACTGVQHYTVRVFHSNLESSCGAPTGGSVCGVGSVTGDKAHCECRPSYVNGGWSSFDNWGACSATCGAGTKRRTRACSNPAPAWGGKGCGSALSEVSPCEQRPCPEHGLWSAWGAWTACSRSCGGGARSRSRTCSGRLHGGIDCSGGSVGTDACNAQPCPIDGGWSTWGTWTACSKTCSAGTKHRSRTCTNPSPAHHGKACYGREQGGLNVEARDSMACTERPCPTHGVWREWGSWSDCSTSCGPGSATRHRTCVDPIHGGTACAGESFDRRSCNADTPCPLDGVYAPWGKWSKCSKTCGLHGLQHRERQCTEPQHGGAACTGDPTENVHCNSYPCDGYTAYSHELSGRCAETIKFMQGGDLGTVNHFTVQAACNAADDCFGYQIDMNDDKYGGAYLMRATAWQHGCAGQVGKCTRGWCFFEKGGPKPQLPGALVRPSPHMPYVPVTAYRSIIGDCTGSHDLDRLGSHHRSLLRDKCTKACDESSACVGYSYSAGADYCLLKGPVGSMDTRSSRFSAGSSIGRCGKRFGACPATGWCYYNKQAAAADPHACCDRQCVAMYATNALDRAAQARRALCLFGCRADSGTVSVSEHLASGSYCGRGDSLLANDEFAQFELTTIADQGASSFCAMGVFYRNVCRGDEGGEEGSR